MCVVINWLANRGKGGLAGFRFAAGWFSRLGPTTGSIRTQILIFCLAMSVIVVALGAYAALGIRHAGDLVARTFDESLMSINYARAAGADFAVMRVVSSQRLMSRDRAIRTKLDNEIEDLAKTLSEDLTVAAKRSQSARASQAAAKVQEAANAWMALHRGALEASVVEDPLKSEANIDSSTGDVDRYSKIVNQQI